MNFQPLKYSFKSTGNSDAKTLVLFHGTGGNEKDLIPLAQNFGNTYNILSLRGNVSEHGMPRFFKRLGMGIFDEEDLRFRTGEVVSFIKDISKKEGFDIEKLIALGYSNGANIIGSTLMLYPDYLSGAILFRPMLPFKELKIFPAFKDIPVFMSSGDFDGMVSVSEIEEYQKLLDKNGFITEWHQINTGHNLTDEDVQLALKWANKYFK